MTKVEFRPIVHQACAYSIGLWLGLGYQGAGCSSVVSAFTHGAMGRRIDPSWSGSIELFLVPSPRLV